jgi:hypothetical protein
MLYRTKRNKDGGTPGEANHGLVTIKEGLYDDDFISRIDTSHDGAEKSYRQI